MKKRSFKDTNFDSSINNISYLYKNITSMSSLSEQEEIRRNKLKELKKAGFTQKESKKIHNELNKG